MPPLLHPRDPTGGAPGWLRYGGCAAYGTRATRTIARTMGRMTIGRERIGARKGGGTMAERTATGERAERAEIGVRPLAAGEEALAFARLAVEAFFHASDVETTARGWTSTMERAPGFDLRQRRG